jgi:hypothetical protein
MQISEPVARGIIKRISDAALELAVMRHGLVSEEIMTVEERTSLTQEELDHIKEDTVDCLTGDETGCLDPEDLNTVNCERLWLESLSLDQQEAT